MGVKGVRKSGRSFGCVLIGWQRENVIGWAAYGNQGCQYVGGVRYLLS